LGHIWCEHFFKYHKIGPTAAAGACGTLSETKSSVGWVMTGPGRFAVALTVIRKPNKASSVEGCQIFLDPNTSKWGKMYQTNTNYLYQTAINYAIRPKIFQLVIICTYVYTNIFHSKALQNLPKLGFLV
jgi:hypothetical protein